MRVSRWQDRARAIERFSSRSATHTRLARSQGESILGCVTLGPDGVLGRHPAGATQLLVVVAGRGEVSGGDGAFHAVAAGDAVLWEAGEEHETRSVEGLVAIVLEADALDVPA